MEVSCRYTQRVTKPMLIYLLIISVLALGNVNILNANAKEKKIIPKKMAPGAIIEYDKTER